MQKVFDQMPLDSSSAHNRLALHRFGWPVTILVGIVLLSGCLPKTPEPKTDATNFKKQSTTQKKSQSFQVTATAYTASAEETDGSPRLTACGLRLSDSHKVIAVSPDLEKAGLTCGTKVKIKDFANHIYEVQDRTAARWHRKIDIFMGTDRDRALQWGKRKVTIEVITEQS